MLMKRVSIFSIYLLLAFICLSTVSIYRIYIFKAGALSEETAQNKVVSWPQHQMFKELPFNHTLSQNYDDTKVVHFNKENTSVKANPLQNKLNSN